MDSGSFFQQNLLSNHLVVDQIFSYLTRSELFNCSLVSKKWVSSTHEFLHRHYSCILNLDLNEPKKLEKASEMLDNSFEVMYNGVYLDFILWHPGNLLNKFPDELAKDVSKPLLQNIFDKIPQIKHVVINFGKYNHFDDHDNFLRMFLELLPIDEVETLKTPELNEEISWDIFLVGDPVFSNLRIVDINISPEDSGFINFLKRCPALKEWCPVVEPSELSYFFAANKASVVKSLIIHESDFGTPQLNQIPMERMILKKLDVDFLEPTSEIVQLILTIILASSSSLTELEINFELFEVVISSGSGTMPVSRVTKVEIIGIEFQEPEDENYEQRKRIVREMIHETKPWRMFPNATIEYKHLEINMDDDNEEYVFGLIFGRHNN